MQSGSGGALQATGGRSVDVRAGCGHYDYMAQRATVGARELKTRLGAYLQQVRQGRTLVITDRGQPVAELKPLHGPSDEDATFQRLEALGAVTRPERRPLAPFRPIRPRGGALVSDAIVADRDDRT
jgi:prevent-host-death family protein